MSGAHKIVAVNGHYEAYDESGNFVISGDTYNECYNDLLEMLEMLVEEARAGIEMENIREKVSA